MIDKSPPAPPMSLGRNPPFMANFVGLRQRGLIADIAVRGKYRVEEDQISAKLHYSPGPWPLVPLTGSIVQDNPTRTLEFYQSNWTFRTSSAASAWLAQARGSMAHRQDPVRPLDEPNIGDESLGFVSTLGPDDRQHERQVTLAARFDNVDIQLSVQGGSDMPPQRAVDLMRTARTRFLANCPSAAAPLKGGDSR